jgi:hypothetical protein
MLHWKQLVHLDEDQLARYDVAEVNLACAAGLPGAESIKPDICLYILDYWARSVRAFTEPRLRYFRRKRYDYYNSEGYFRILLMVTLLQRDLGLRYNPDKIPDDVPLDTADTFIHGAVMGHGGTCGTMAVVYTAVGRRLGYPLKLVAASRGRIGHLFPRWEGANGERFNIEGTNRGLNCSPDDYYRTGEYAVPPEIEKKGCILKSQTRREELANFLAQRGFRWADCRNYRKAVESFAWAHVLAPHNARYMNKLQIKMNEWLAQLDRRKPPGFPNIYLKAPRRRFPDALPLEMEQQILGREATEDLLNDKALDRKWWEPLRRGLKLRTPHQVVATFHEDGCAMQLHYREPVEWGWSILVGGRS